MKRFILTLTTIFICTIAYAHTINWRVGNTILETTTCDSGDSITPPTAPYKYGYHFVKWKLPYTQIEYLESTGTQWIDTGVVPTYSMKYDTSFSAPAPSGFGARNIAFGGFQCGYNSLDFFSTTSSSEDRWLCTESKEKIRVTIENHIATRYLNGGNIIETHIFNGNGITNFRMYLFAVNTAGRAQIMPSGSRMYYTKIWQNDILVRDFIPVLDKDGTPCMYDKVEGKFYYNAGTGQFVAGPVISE